MNFLELEYCDKCKTQECTMPEITHFLDWIQTEENMNYEHYSCPDKESDKFTADFQFKSIDKILTVEVKRLHHAFSKRKKQEAEEIASERGMRIINGMFYQATNCIDDKVYDYIANNFVVDMLMAIVSDKEAIELGEQLIEYLTTADLDLVDSSFVYEKKNKKKIEIAFRPLTSELKRVSEKGRILQMFPTSFSEEGISLSDFWNNTFDLSSIKEKVLKNLIKSNNSFEGVDSNRIVLQVIVMKYSLDLVLSMPELLDVFISNLKEEITSYKTEMNENKFNFDNAYICINTAGLDEETDFRIIDISCLLRS